MDYLWTLLHYFKTEIQNVYRTHTFMMEDVYDASTDESDSASVDSEVEEVVDCPQDGLSISREEADRWFMFC